jgi:hypothetical protein
MKKTIAFPESLQSIGLDVGEDCRRMAALIAQDEPNIDMNRLMATVAYQLGRACGTIVDPKSVGNIGARILLDAGYNFQRGQIAEIAEARPDSP